MVKFETVSLDKGGVKAVRLLAKTRAIKGLTLAQVSKATLIKVEYLKALEEEQYHRLPSGAYTLNYIKEYARFLGLDAHKVVTSYRREVAERHHLAEDVYRRKIVHSRYLLVIPRIIKYLLLAVAALLFALYLSWLIANIYLPPKIVLNTPGVDTVVHSAKILVSGQAELETQVTVNSQPAAVTADGSFELWVNLHQGLNKIEVKAIKKNKRPNIIEREVLFKN
jgi:cytoskeletal protein RodZ